MNRGVAIKCSFHTASLIFGWKPHLVLDPPVEQVLLSNSVDVETPRWQKTRKSAEPAEAILQLFRLD